MKLKGKIENCYGIKKLEFDITDSDNSNKAIIYAPNGVMKTSFANIFNDISKGNNTLDRIFPDFISTYSIEYGGTSFNYNSRNNLKLKPNKSIYVIKSYDESFKTSDESMKLLLSDEETKKTYDNIISNFINSVSEIEKNLSILTGVSKDKIKNQIIKDFSLGDDADWPDIIDALWHEKIFLSNNLRGIRYNDLFSDKVIDLYKNADFDKHIVEYTFLLKEFLKRSTLLNDEFNDYNISDLTNNLEKNNLFLPGHHIRLQDGREIDNISDWKDLVDQELGQLTKDENLSKEFEKINKLLSKNADGRGLRRTLQQNPFLIPQLKNISQLKREYWAYYSDQMEIDLEYYYNKISVYSKQIKDIYKLANNESKRWEEILNVFNRRFKVPFEAKIENKANYLLKDESPQVAFTYKLEGDENGFESLVKRDLLIPVLSDGEKRALYLLNIIFDIEKIREDTSNRYLLIADDIADSFDYKNKYAILEYLNDISKDSNIDLLILTHNFDFFRTVRSRLNIDRKNCYIALKDQEGIISLNKFKYLKDYFKNVIIANLNANVQNEEWIKTLISSIPFYRNLADYLGNEDDKLQLTYCLHLKDDSKYISTDKLSIGDIWDVVKKYVNNDVTCSNNNLYYEELLRIADNIVKNDNDEVSLENKLILSIATRLLVEKLMINKLNDNGCTYSEIKENQTRELYGKVIDNNLLSDSEREMVEDVLLITPEIIHLNSFMYEPLIDISSWKLHKLYIDGKKAFDNYRVLKGGN